MVTLARRCPILTGAVSMPNATGLRRVALVELIEQGATFRQAAACLNVAPATAHRWWRRFRGAQPTELTSGAWALDRSSRPYRSPGRTSAAEEQRICEARRRTNLGPGRLAGDGRVRGRCDLEAVFRQPLCRDSNVPRKNARSFRGPHDPFLSLRYSSR